MAFRIPAGAYQISTSARLTPEQAARGVFPDDALVAHVDTEHHGRSVTYTYFVEYPDATSIAV